MARSFGPRSRATRQLSRLWVNKLEDRIQPSANYSPPSNFQTNPAYAAVNTRLESQTPLEIALTYLHDHAAEFNATLADLANPIVATLAWITAGKTPMSARVRQSTARADARQLG